MGRVLKTFQGYVDSALQALQQPHVTDEDVHVARKELKKARAALRMLRSGLEDAVFERENKALRDAARPLSAARDAKVLLDTLEMLKKRYGAAARALPLAGLIQAIKRARVTASRRVRTGAPGLVKSRRILRNARDRQRGLRVVEHRSVIDEGVRRVYSRGRKALRAALETRDAEALHEWRKQVKYLWHQLQILEAESPGIIGELADQTHRLADYLGDDHDLAVLRHKAAMKRTALKGEANRAAFLALIDRCRAQLQAKAFVLGRRVYKGKPKAFVASLRAS